MIDSDTEIQQATCRKHNAPFVVCPPEYKLGIAEKAKTGVLPIHGLRHKPEEGTTGWFIWAGEFSEDPEFFKPLHVEHIEEWCPRVLPYLGLAPGWRFLLGDDGYEDVWEDPTLLHEEGS